MKQKKSIIQPYIHLSLRDVPNGDISAPAAIHIYDACSDNIESGSFPKTLDVIPSVGCVWIIAYDSPEKSRFICIGSQSKKITVDIGDYRSGFVAIFDDDAVYFNKGTPDTLLPADIADRVIDFVPDKMCPEYNFIGSLASCSDFGDKCNAFKEYLSSSKRRYEFDHELARMRDIITNADGDCHIAALAKSTGYSDRHINRQFNSVYGFGPKELCKRKRFQHALREMFENPNRQNSEFIQNIGYSDQAHFQREFKAFMAETPKQFAKKLKG